MPMAYSNPKAGLEDNRTSGRKARGLRGRELLPGTHRTLRKLGIDSGLETFWEKGPVRGLEEVRAAGATDAFAEAGTRK